MAAKKKTLPNTAPPRFGPQSVVHRATGAPTETGGIQGAVDVNVTGPNPLPVSVEEALDVLIQDSTNPLLILPLVRVDAITTLAVQAVKESYLLTVSTASGITTGAHIRVINSTGDSYYFGSVLGVSGNDLTVDTPIDDSYPAGSEVTVGRANMNVDGSGTPVHFHLRTGTPSIPSSIDITRMILIIECDDDVALSYFADLPTLTRGIVFRKEDSAGNLRNYFNVKKNIEFAQLGYDLTRYEALKQTDGINGIAFRLTFGSSGKMGAVIRVAQDEQLGMLIQDDLSSLINFTCVVEGHVTDEPY